VRTMVRVTHPTKMRPKVRGEPSEGPEPVEIKEPVQLVLITREQGDVHLSALEQDIG